MNATLDTREKYSIQWTVILVYAAILAIGITGWIGIFHLLTVLLR